MPPNPLADLGAGLSTKSAPDHPVPAQHGPLGQTERAFTAASTFLSGLMAISATQFLGAPLKMIDPKFYEAYMAFTKQSFGVLITTMTQWWAPTVVRVSGDKSIPKQLFHRADGSLECRFPKRLVMMANHQLYTDWLYLWWIAYTNNMHGYIYIILKESLKNIPIIGWGAQFYNFIFLKRKWEEDKDSFQKHLDQLNNSENPMWLLIFPEGTNLAQGTREKSAKWAKEHGMQDMKHQLLPRSKGLQFCLQNLKETTEWLYDCTIGYEGIPPRQFGQDIFTLRSSMFEGRPPKSVNMHFRRFKISDIPIQNDKSFDIWLRNRWREKDYLLEHFAKYNRFPENANWLIKQRQSATKGPVPAKSIETQIKSNSLEEFLSIFAPLSSIMAALFLFYGEGKPEDMLQMIGEAAQQQQKVALLRDDDSQTQPLKLKTVRSSITDDTNARPLPNASMENPPSRAQQNLLQQYVAAIRPAIEKQIDLPDRALRMSNVNGVGASPRLDQKKKIPAQKPVAPPKAATAVPETVRAKGQIPTSNPRKAASAAAGPVTAIQANSSSKKPLIHSDAVVKPKETKSRPLNGRTFSNSSTVHPHDSISAVNAPTKKPYSPRRATGPPVKRGLQVKKAGQTPAKVGSAASVPDPKPAKNVSIDPAMLMRMKAGSKQMPPRGVQIDPGILAKMKGGKQ